MTPTRQFRYNHFPSHFLPSRRDSRMGPQLQGWIRAGCHPDCPDLDLQCLSCLGLLP